MPRPKSGEMPTDIPHLQRLVQRLSIERSQLIARVSELVMERESILADVRNIYEGARMRELRGRDQGGSDASDRRSDPGYAGDVGGNGAANRRGVLGD